ncbi:histidine kinase [Poseidonibacter parvus]|uniref:Histidine kinase n=1 Tax=Poseidonibacter parvus TaxID=1850254 RepID=A0A1P8KLJ5_9BACT|nr:PAS domain-containing protein [Poseidonibacter parvus]APW65402.1 histidine kinase [Poseidonibacter parvus]
MNDLSNIQNFQEGHPVRVYLEENILTRKLFQELLQTNMQEDYQRFYNIFNQICEIEKHFARKENQLFPYLEKYGWTGPSQGMWAFHDQIREEIKFVRKKVEAKDSSDILNDAMSLFNSIDHLLQVEEGRLLPRALEMLNEDDWKEMYEGDKEIGWMFADAPVRYPEVKEEDYVHPSEDKKRRKLPFSLEDRTHFDEGYLTPEQVNFIFKFLPIDITYVDENDIVIFYNRGDDRVFPRSAGIIGREVKFCHPPKSVDQVLKILEEFKAGRQDTAEFWIQFKGKFIHIRYFAIRDEEKNYKGVIEMSQDITDIKKLEGDKRLLDWA